MNATNKIAAVESPYSQVIRSLRRLYQEEISGASRYLHYSLMVKGMDRSYLKAWFKAQAVQSANHAEAVGEILLTFVEHLPDGFAEHRSCDVRSHASADLLRDTLRHEERVLGLYRSIESAAEAERDLLLESFAKNMVQRCVSRVGAVTALIEGKEGQQWWSSVS